MKVRAREASRQKKLQAKAKQSHSAPQDEEPDDIVELDEVSRQHPLPWLLLAISWLGFAAWFWLR